MAVRPIAHRSTTLFGLFSTPHVLLRTMSSTAAPAAAPLHPLPPFTSATAHTKVKAAQDKWNTRDPALVAPAYTEDSVWRNRDDFIKGRDEIKQFLTRKWAKEKNYRLRKELFAFTDNKMYVTRSSSS